MEELQSFEDFAAVMKKDISNDVNYEKVLERIKQACSTDRGIKRYRRRYKVVFVLAVILVLGFAGFAFADSIRYQLFGSFGEVLFEMGQMSEKKVAESQESSRQPEEMTALQESLRQGLEPGESMVFIDVENFEPDQRMYGLEMPVILKDEASVAELVSGEFKLPRSLPEGYEFLEGEIKYQYDGMYEQGKKLYEKARAEGLKYAYEKLEGKRKLNNVVLHYGRSNGSKLQIMITAAMGFGPSEYSGTEKAEIEKIKVKGHEVLYSDKTGFAIWVESKLFEKVKYEVWTYGVMGDIGRDEMVEMIKGFE